MIDTKMLNKHTSKTYRVTHVPNPVEVILTCTEANRLAIQCICDVSNWKPHWFLTEESGSTFVTEIVVAHSTHSFSYEEKIRQASAEDLFIFQLFEKLKHTQ